MIDVYQKTAHQKSKCEDYVVSNDKDLIILSDGCSSSKDTHLGSMLYCEKGLEYFGKYLNENIIQQDWRTLALMASGIFGKRNNSYSYLDATCMILKEYEGIIDINIIGDGLLFFKEKKCDSPVFIEYSYSENTPMYPSYLLDIDRYDKYKELVKNQKYISTWITSDNKESVIFHEDNFVRKLFRKDEMEYVGIASDGIFDFQQNGKSIDTKIIFDHITAFKGSGEFLKRKMSHMFKTLGKEEIFPHDDFSIGVWKNDNI